ncbi:MAG: 50S ribosomal protein L4 [Acidimicrobiia bacterium]
MATVDLRTTSGATAGAVDLPDAVFGIEPNVAVMHQVVTAQLAAARAGTQSTLTRAEVRGGGAKPWKQKGTGRARQGSIRSPQWRGGGVALGPKPRSYRQRTPKKMVQLALRSALSDRAAAGRVVVVDGWAFAAPRTKEATAALAALGVGGRALMVLSRDDEAAYKSFRNLPDVHVIAADELNAYDVLCSDWVLFTAATVPTAPAATAARAGGAAPVATTPPAQEAPAGGEPPAPGAPEPADEAGAPAPAAAERPAPEGGAAP